MEEDTPTMSKYIPHVRPQSRVDAFDLGYEQAEQDIIVIIQTRISEIIGDAQPKPALRAELQELINKINNHE
jgi:hypothetical protein